MKDTPPTYTILAPGGLHAIQVDRGAQLLLEMRPGALPGLFQVVEVPRSFEALLQAIDDRTVHPQHSGRELAQLRETLTHLAAHERKVCDALNGMPLETWSEALNAALEDYRPDERGLCHCPYCDSRYGRLELVTGEGEGREG